MTAYIGIIHKEKGSVFGISFPDFPGCIAASDTLDGAPHAAREALEAHVAVLAEGGEALPEPRGLNDILRDRQWNDFQALVIVDTQEESRQVRVNISVDKALLNEIDRVAEQRGMTRSGFLAVASRSLLKSYPAKRPRPPKQPAKRRRRQSA